LAVNTPGFPVVGLNASGEVLSLVAAGMVLRDEEIAALNGPQAQLELPGPDDEALRERLSRFQAKADRLTKLARSRRLSDILKRGA